MKSLITVLLTALLSLPVLAQKPQTAANTPNICKVVFEACAAKDFKRDDLAPAGKKMWADCAGQIIEQKKAVEGINLDLASFEITNCQKYHVAKLKFDANWAKSHKAPKAKK